jgi:hypothetical protein
LVLVDNSSEILGDRIEGVRFEFGEFPAQQLFDPVHLVKKGAAIHLQLLAAQAPVRAEQEVISEKSVFRFTQNTATYQTKIGRILFLFSRIRTAAIPASQMVPGNRTGVCAQLRALAEAIVTSSKNTPKDAVARDFFVAADKASTRSTAMYAGGTGQTDCVGTTPIHLNIISFPETAYRTRPALFWYEIIALIHN